MFSRNLIILNIIIILFCTFNSDVGYASYKDLQRKNPTKAKKRYCLKLTQYFHEKIKEMNYPYDTYRLGGLGTQNLDPRRWTIKIGEPFFWSNILKIWYEQITKGKHDEFKYFLTDHRSGDNLGAN